MKIKDLDVSVSAVVAISTAFLGLSGYLSVRAQANVLGIVQGTLSSNWRYVLEAAEFAGSFLFLLLVASAAISLVFAVGVVVRHVFPGLIRKLELTIERLVHSLVFVMLLVAATLVAALYCVTVISNVPHGIAIGVLRPVPTQNPRLGGIFLLSVILLAVWGALAFARARFGHDWLRNKWVLSLSGPSLVILALTLPLAYGAGIRPQTFVSVRLLAETPDETSCGLLIERDDKRVAYWTAVRTDREVVGVVREVPLETKTLELGPVVNIREQIWSLLNSDRKDELCSLTVRPPAR
jgi:hypothetical protein